MAQGVERITLIPENLVFSGRRLSRDYSNAQLDYDDIKKCEKVAIVGNKSFPSPFVWKPPQEEKDSQKGRKLAFCTAQRHANLIAQYTPRPGAISVAQDVDGNAMFALSVLKDRKEYFDRIKCPELKQVLEAST